MRIPKLAGLLLKAKSLQAAMAFGISGVAFSVAMLLLARYLPETEFGLLALCLALIQLGVAIGALGADLVVIRKHLLPSPRIAAASAGTSLLAATGIALAALYFYDAPRSALLPLWIALLAAPVSRVGSAFFQSQNRIMSALSLTQVHNYLLLLAVPAALVLGDVSLQFFLIFAAAGYVGSTIVGWLAARRQLSGEPVVLGIGAMWREGLSGMGIGLAAMLLAQTERFVIPVTLGYREMAEFGVLAAVVVAPFRMMQVAVGFTLLPRLRAAPDAATAQRLIRNEAALAAAVGVGGAVGVFALGPWVVHLFVQDKYQLSSVLFGAAIGVGWIRLMQSVAVATVNALASTAELAALNGTSWVALAVAAGSAWALSGFGLVGVILGVGIGWLLQAAVAVTIGRRAVARLGGGDAQDPG